MNILKNKKYIFLLTFLFCFLICSPAFAFTLTEVDDQGNKTVLIDIDNDKLNDLSCVPSLYTVDTGVIEAPAPDTVAGLYIYGLKDVVAAHSFNNACTSLVIDFGPNWQSIIEEEGSNHSITGRYAYLYWNEYNEETGYAEDRYGNRGHDTYTYGYDDEGREYLKVNGKHAFASWNATTQEIDVISNQYNSLFPSELTITDIWTYDSENVQYPCAISFNDGLLGNIALDIPLFTKHTEFTWDESLSVPDDGEDTGGTDDNTGGTADLSTIEDLLEKCRNLLESLVYQMGNVFKNLPVIIFEQFSELLNSIYEAITNGFSSVVEAISSMHNGLIEKLSAILDLLENLNGGSDLDDEIVDDEGNSILDLLGDSLKALAIFLAGLGAGTIESIADAVTDFADFVSNIGEDIFDFLGNALLQFGSVLALFALIGTWFSLLFGFLPPEFTAFIMSMISIFVVVVLIKIALNVK